MSAAKVVVSGLSGRYARALFDLAREQKSLDAVETGLASLKAMLAESDDLRRLVSSPLYSRDDQAKAVAGVAKKAGLPDPVRNLLGVLAANRRLASLEAVIRDFGRLMAHHRGEISADVVSAQPLNAAQEKALKAKLKSITGQDVTIDMRVDESLLGGLVVKVGSRMIDSSLKTKLNNLENAMKGV